MSEYNQDQNFNVPPAATTPSLFSDVEGLIAGLGTAEIAHMTERRGDGILEHATELIGGAITGNEVANSQTTLGKLETAAEGAALTGLVVKAEEWFTGNQG